MQEQRDWEEIGIEIEIEIGIEKAVGWELKDKNYTMLMGSDGNQDRLFGEDRTELFHDCRKLPDLIYKAHPGFKWVLPIYRGCRCYAISCVF